MKIHFAVLLSLAVFSSSGQTAHPQAAGNPNQNPFMASALSNVMGTAGTFLSNRFGLNTNGVYQQGGEMTIADVQNVLQQIQANIEQTLPIVAALTSGNQGVHPTTGLPNQLINAVDAGRTPSAYAGVIGENPVAMNPQTYHQLVALQNSLQQSLLSLRDLNASGMALNSGHLTPTGLTNRISPITNGSFDPRILENSEQQLGVPQGSAIPGVQQSIPAQPQPGARGNPGQGGRQRIPQSSGASGAAPAGR